MDTTRYNHEANWNAGDIKKEKAEREKEINPLQITYINQAASAALVSIVFVFIALVFIFLISIAFVIPPIFVPFTIEITLEGM